MNSRILLHNIAVAVILEVHIFLKYKGRGVQIFEIVFYGPGEKKKHRKKGAFTTIVM